MDYELTILLLDMSKAFDTLKKNAHKTVEKKYWMKMNYTS